MFRDIYAISYQMRRELYHRIFTVFSAVFSCILFVSLVCTFFIFPVNSHSSTMAPDIPDTSVVLVSPLLKSPDRGRIMLVQPVKDEKLPKTLQFANFFIRFFTAQQLEFFGAENKIKPSLKRVIGLPGDSVKIKDYIVYIKPVGQKQFLTEFELTKINYNITIPMTPDFIDRGLGAYGDMDEITLSSNQYFLLGDDRTQCVDCRIWGPLTKDNFLGRALFIYFPFTKIRHF